MKSEECRLYFSKNVRQLRKAYGLTQTQFGKNVGVHCRTVAFWETGDTLPRIEKLCEIGEFFNVEPFDMLTRELRLEVETTITVLK